MTVALRTGQDVGLRSTTVNPITVTLPSAPIAGNLLVASFTTNQGTIGATPTGWTLLSSHVGASVAVAVYMRQVVGGDPSAWTYTPAAGTSNEWHVAEFTGFTTPTLDSTGANDSGTSTVLTTTSGTTGPLAGTGDLLYMAIFTTNVPAAPITYSNSWTPLTLTARQMTAWKAATDQGPQSTTVTWSSGVGKTSSVIVAISPTALAAPTTEFTGWGLPIS